ncbi:MAG TPA: lysophospholipid acyltransferase family protein [Usitatibacter sp.]|nr:lysophospholipid acyltransferase family protein [Usitatibacter sp.]
MTTLRSAVFLVAMVLLTGFFGILVPLSGFANFRAGAFVARTYARIALAWARWCLGITYEVSGWENVPREPVILMAKHQSAWETIFMQAKFPPQCWIVKKELLWLPFVGWSLIAIRAIAIDRKSGKNARDQVVEQGRKRLRQGMWISIFPEGTRVAPGKRGRYGIGGALLATKTGAPILPMAHNAGEMWPRYAFRKRPGCVKVVIGPLIRSDGRDVIAVNNEVEGWIEGQMRLISPELYAGA